MSRLVTLPTDHTAVSDALDAIAPLVDESSVRIGVFETINGGEWVRFRFVLADGSPVWEGVGRCEVCSPVGDDRYELTLVQLSFDARNEVMFERILMFGAQGPRTGPHPRLPKEGEVPENPVPRYSPVPPPPRKPPPQPAAKLSTIVKERLRPKPGAPPPAESRPGALECPPEFAERARELSRRLNLMAPSLARGRWTEARVLEAALRMGLDSLEGLLAKRDE
jgi:hypothetical protein